MRNPVTQLVWNILIWVDQGLNVFLFLGDPDETVSSHIGRVKRRNGGRVPRHRFVMRLLDKMLEKIDPNHSIDSIEEDEGADSLLDPVQRRQRD